jgi:hypothetical protein
MRCGGRRRASPSHLEPRTAEEALDAVEVDDQRHAFALLVEVALALGRLLVDPAAGFCALVDARVLPRKESCGA